MEKTYQPHRAEIVGFVKLQAGTKAQVEMVETLPDGVGWLVTYWQQKTYRTLSAVLDQERVYKTMLVTPEDLGLDIL